MAGKTDPGISPRGYTLYPGRFPEFISYQEKKTLPRYTRCSCAGPRPGLAIMADKVSQFYQQMCERLERLNVLPRHNEMVIAIGFFLVFLLVVILGTRPFSRLLSRQ